METGELIVKNSLPLCLEQIYLNDNHLVDNFSLYRLVVTTFIIFFFSFCLNLLYPFSLL